MTYPDILFVVGTVSMVAGIAWIYPPAGLIAFGLLAAVAGVRASEKKAPTK